MAKIYGKNFVTRVNELVNNLQAARIAPAPFK